MERWKEVEALFEAALERPSEYRAAFIEKIEVRDPELAAELKSLLEASDEADTFFDGLSDRLVEPLIPAIGGEPAPPESVGVYRIVREIGRGGMSTVYLAERADDQFEQQVAVKVVRQGMADGERVARFLSERRILASLNHANVARLFDGGVLEDGRPYFVMEYVDGKPLDRHADALRLGLKDRVRLFLTVLGAVQYAHRNLVVHRDLKPSNILVTDAGEVKLLDFGIAKLLSEDAADATMTQTGNRWMTPEYAAPEQIRGEPITTATDVYQLGVLLYRLLTGHRPYRVSPTSTYELERAVCEDEPTRPSMVVTRTEEVSQGTSTMRITPEAVAEKRATEIPVLRRTLSGDLDAILLKALRKEPEARYATAEAFAEDLRRYLGGLPVEARRGTLGYRARKYVRRNRWALAVAAFIVLLLIGYAVTVTVQAREVKRQRDLARLEAAKAEEVSVYLIDLFAVSDANEARNDTMTAREILARSVERIRLELDAEPEVQAEALSVVGRLYGNMGFYNESIALLDSALAVRRGHFQGMHPDVADGLYYLGEMLVQKADFEAAKQRFEEAVRLWRMLGDRPRQEARSLRELATVHMELDDYATADALYQEALALQRATFGAQHRDIVETLRALGNLRRSQGHTGQADSLYQEALAMQRLLLGPQHPEVAALLAHIAFLREDQGRFEEAEAAYRQALDIYQYRFGNEHPDVAKTLNDLGLLYMDTNKPDASERMLRQALAIKESLLGPQHPSLAVAYFNLGLVLYNQGDYAAAESLYRQTLAIDRAAYGERHSEVAADLTLLAQVIHEKGDLEEADRLYAQALAIRRQTLPAGLLGMATLLLGYGHLRLDQNRIDEAEAFLNEALAIRRDALAEDHWRIAEVEGALAACLAARGRFEDAAPRMQASYEVLLETLGEEDRRTRRLRNRLVAFYDAWGNPTEADRYREGTIETREPKESRE